MLEVHPPEEKIRSMKDFFLHLFTITVGLFIALTLEGGVEWQHHRHLVHQAEVALGAEIAENAKAFGNLQSEIEAERAQVGVDLKILARMRAQPKGEYPVLNLNLDSVRFNGAAWKASQSTGAFGYMTYDDAQEYSSIYSMQDEVMDVQRQEVDEGLHAAALMNDLSDDGKETPERIDEIIDRVHMVEMRLAVLKVSADSLFKLYKNYETDYK
jgi:hypothetical protein